MNHTSDQHEWFQRSRRSPAGSRLAKLVRVERYARQVSQKCASFSRTSNRRTGVGTRSPARISGTVFTAISPTSTSTIPKSARRCSTCSTSGSKWESTALRLDAVPYLFEREGTNCENLPETHAFLRDVRSHIDEKFNDRMLLAEANQWPEDAAAYFGDGDECHMNFHFPLMPRLFMAVEREDRSPIVDILEQTPELPPLVSVGNVPAQPR